MCVSVWVTSGVDQERLENTDNDGAVVRATLGVTDVRKHVSRVEGKQTDASESVVCPQ